MLGVRYSVLGAGKADLSDSSDRSDRQSGTLPGSARRGVRRSGTAARSGTKLPRAEVPVPAAVPSSAALLVRPKCRPTTNGKSILLVKAPFALPSG